jgi:uncharacterized protein
MKINYLGNYIYRLKKEDRVCFFNTLSLERVYADDTNNLNKSIQQNNQKAYITKKESQINTLQLVVTTKCNFRCAYCQLFQNGGSPSNIEEMSFDTATSIYDKYRNVFESGTVMITGGEPLINFEIVKYFLENAYGRKMIFTNASLLNKKIIDVFLNTKTFVIVSLDGDESYNNSYRRTYSGLDTHEQVIEGIHLLSKMGCPFGISMVITPDNLVELSQICRKIIEKIHPVSLGVNIPHYTKLYQYDFPEDIFANELVKLYFLSKEKGIFIDQIARVLSPIINTKPKTMDCSACGSKAVIYPDATESNCILKYMFTHGNDLNIWSGSSPINEPMCNDCIAIGACGGGCKFDGEMFFNSAFDKRRCFASKRLVIQILDDLFDVDISMLKKITSTSNVWSVGHDRV